MDRKFYFCGSIRGGRQDVDFYKRIIDEMKKYGKVFTEAVGNKEVDDLTNFNRTPKEIHDRDVDWLEDSEAIIAEVTQPSLGVGYEIGRAVAWNKKMLCLFRSNSDKHLSCMIGGLCDHENVTIQEYNGTDEEIQQIVEKFLKK